MRKYTSLLILALMLVSTGLCNNNSDLIYFRRAYLIELGLPPSVAEIEWLLTYETDPRTAGISHILNKKYGALESEAKKAKRIFYLSSDQECTLGKRLTESQQHYILKYQAGNLNATVEESKHLLIQHAVSIAELKEEPIDYLALCLWGKYTNATEFNILNKIYNNTVGEDSVKLYAVVTSMLASNNFLYY